MFKIEAVVNDKVIKKNMVRGNDKERAIRVFIENMKKKPKKMLLFVLDLNNSDYFVYSAVKQDNNSYLLKLIKYEVLGKTMVKIIQDFNLPLKNGLKY